jgi:hypothetical protein
MSGYLGDLSIEQAAALEQLKVEFDDWVAQNEKVVCLWLISFSGFIKPCNKKR